MELNDKSYLGKVCSKEHFYKDTGKSIRWKSSRTCVMCQYETHASKEYKQYLKNYRAQK